MRNPNERLILRGLLLAVVLGVLWVLSSLVIYIILALVLAILLQPVVNMVGKVRVGKYALPIEVDVAITLLVIYSLLAVILIFLFPYLLDQASALGNLQADTIRKALEEPLVKLSEALAKRNIQFHPQQALDKFLDQEMANLLNFDQFISSFGTIVGVTGDVLIGFFAVSFITFNFLREPEMPTQVLMLLAPRKNARQVMNILNESTRLLRRYFIGLLIQFTLVTTLLMLGLILVGAYNPVLIAVVAGVFNLVPYVGPIIGITFACLITLTSTLAMDFSTVTLPLLLNVLGVFGFVMAFDAFLNVPLIYSRTVRAHPLEIFLVILGSGKLAGIPGMILAIPSYTVIRVILREFFNQYEVVRRLTRNL